MNYKEFEKALRDRLQELTSLNTDVVIKNNHAVHHGLSFVESNTSMTPLINLDNYYQALQAGIPIEQITTEVFALYQNLKDNTDLDVRTIFSFEKIKDKIVYRLVNYSQNKVSLTQIPYILFHDLAIVFYIQFDTNFSYAVRNIHLTWWDKTANELYFHAQRNTRRIFPLSVTSLDAFMLNMCSPCEDADFSVLANFNTPRVGILTNKHQLFGAACILYEHILETIGMVLRENYYIIPSSVHEVLILRKSIARDIPSLSQMIQEVNTKAVATEEVLADHPYYYDCSTGILQMAQ